MKHGFFRQKRLQLLEELTGSKEAGGVLQCKIYHRAPWWIHSDEKIWM